MAKLIVAFRNFAKAPKLSVAKLYAVRAVQAQLYRCTSTTLPLYKHNSTAAFHNFPVNFAFVSLCFDAVFNKHTLYNKQLHNTATHNNCTF